MVKKLDGAPSGPINEVSFWVSGRCSPAGSKQAFPHVRDKTVPYWVLDAIADAPRARAADVLRRWISKLPLGVRVADDTKALKSWQATVRAEARYHVRHARPVAFPVGIPLRLELLFVRARPQAHFVGGKPGPGRLRAQFAQAMPVVRPDVLKLARAVEDALTGVVYADDAQIVDEVLAKRFGESPGVRVTVSRVFFTSNEAGCVQKDLL